jgi:hypothetical protein
MFEKEKNEVLFFLKNIQFTLRTWKNATEIARAYGTTSTVSGSKPGRGKHNAVIVFIVVVCVAGLGAGIYFSVFRNQKPQKPKIVRTAVKKPPRAFTKKPVERVKQVVPEKKETEVVKKTVDTATVSTDTAVQPVDTVPPIEKPVVRKYRLQSSQDTGAFFSLVANKATKSLYVLQKQDQWRVVKEYNIAIGVQDGRKETAGDKRTPEGSYFIIGRKERSELNIIYGPLAYVLDYPNEQDRREGRTGQGIWIHGTDPDSLPVDTKGCLEMNNSDLKELSGLLKWGIGTPVTIVYNETLTDPVTVPNFRSISEKRSAILLEHERKLSQFSEFVQKWKTAWENKQIDEYEMCYDTLQFRGQGQEWPQWKERKLRTFSLYDTIAITIDKLVVTDEDDYSAIVKFLQRYTTNLNNIENGKKLNLEKVNDIWKITGESTCPKEELLL